MTYSAQKIEEIFTRIASIRISRKRSGDEIYKGDAGYWDGGRCEYGQAHNLKEDCQTLGKFFTKISELKNTRRKLTSFEDKAEFEKTKQDLISQCNTAIAGLQVKTRQSASIGGICLIWESFISPLKSILDDAREGLEDLKRGLERTSYDSAKKLKRLQIEERSLQKSIEENLRKARNESDPQKKKRLLLLVDDDKIKLASNLEEQKKISVGNDFNPDKHIQDFLEKLEKRLNPNRSSRFPNANPTTPTSSGVGGSTNDPLNPFQPNSNPNQNFFQQNQQLILISAIALLAFLYFYFQEEKEPNYF